MSRIRIVVADQAEAVFYDLPSLQAAPREVAHISDPAAHLHNRDLVSDRPGRSYESVGGARHAIARENDPRQLEAVRFARRIARRLDDGAPQGRVRGIDRGRRTAVPRAGAQGAVAADPCAGRARDPQGPRPQSGRGAAPAPARVRRRAAPRVDVRPTPAPARRACGANCDGSRAGGRPFGASCSSAHTWRQSSTGKQGAARL